MPKRFKFCRSNRHSFRIRKKSISDSLEVPLCGCGGEFFHVYPIDFKQKSIALTNYTSAIREQKWDSELLELISAIYKKQELYLKQRPV